MAAEIKFTNGDRLVVNEEPRQLLKLIQAPDEIGPLKVVEVEDSAFINVEQIRSVSKPGAAG